MEIKLISSSFGDLIFVFKVLIQNIIECISLKGTKTQHSGHMGQKNSN